MGAGILPYSIYNGEIYILFSREYIIKTKDAWSDFGGKKENRESYLETAIREGWEETVGFFGTKESVRRLVNENTKGYITFRGHRSYLVKIPYNENLPNEFRRHFLKVKRETPELILKNGLYEKDKLKWVKLKNIYKFKSNMRRFYKHFTKYIIQLLNS
tara:strand:- start:1440 stop:1916 length:477 start_codon:yes stop_codon:yes gene_type:complete